MSKPCFKKIEFYITNVCNLTCEQCNRFNNWDFRGWQAWQDYESTYQRWADLIDIKAVTIMGGEPLLNPTVTQWMLGINRIFKIPVQVLTNGTHISKVRGLYEALTDYEDAELNRNSLAVSLHNLDDLDQLRSDILAFLKPPVSEMSVHPELWNCDYQWADRNGVMVNVYHQNLFHTATVQRNANGRFVLFDSNPQQAHDACVFVKYKSYHFIRGKLYKCGPSALMPEFDEQHRFDISDSDRELLHSYQPLTVDNFDTIGSQWLATLDQPIPQCKFCPIEKQAIRIAPIKKGTQHRT